MSDTCSSIVQYHHSLHSSSTYFHHRAQTRTVSALVTLMVPYDHLPDDQPGPEFKLYNLPPSLLTAPYFLERSYEPVWDSNQIVLLQENTVEHFDVYEHWLLTSELRLTRKAREAKTGETTREQTKAGYEKLLECCSSLGHHLSV